MKRHRTQVSVIASVFRALVFIRVMMMTGCATVSRPNDTRDDDARLLASRITPGMTRTDVERLLGPSVGSEPSPALPVWYLKGNKAYAPGGVGVLYKNGKVSKVYLNPGLER